MSNILTFEEDLPIPHRLGTDQALHQSALSGSVTAYDANRLIIVDFDIDIPKNLDGSVPAA
jgi:hypothetical protein